MASHFLPESRKASKDKESGSRRQSSSTGSQGAAATAAVAAYSSRRPSGSETRTNREDGGTYDMRGMASSLPAVPERKPVPGSAERKSLDKPLPPAPVREDRLTERESDTTVHQRQAPAVTHETVYQTVHEHEQQQITREIHQHHYYHRILPVHDVEVLPAVHYIADKDGVRQLSPKEVSSRYGQDTQRIIEEGFKKSLPKDSSPKGPRQFTARPFEGTDGDYREETGPDGVKRSETTWVHPPTLATGARDSGQTKPFHFDHSEADTRDKQR